MSIGMSLADGVSFFAASPGTGAFVFLGARASFRTPAQAVTNGSLVNGGTYSYLAEDSLTVPTQREWGRAVFTAAGSIFSRSPLGGMSLGSDTGTNLVNFTVPPIISLTVLAEDIASQAVSPFQFGAIADGNSHPLSSKFATLAAAQGFYNLVPNTLLTSLNQQIDWAACAQAAYTAFGAPGSEHSTVSPNLNKQLHFQAGMYFFGNDYLAIRNTVGGVIFGDGIGSTSLQGQGSLVLLFDGLWYSHISDFTVQNFNASCTQALAIDGVGPGTIPGHTYATITVQGTTLQNLLISSGGGQFCFTLGFYSASNGQGSEMQYLNLHMSACSQACYRQDGFNALNNNFYGGDCQVFQTHGLYSSNSVFNVYTMAFESTYGYTQVLNGGYDIFFASSGVGGSGFISGCRSESPQFFFGGQEGRITGCYFNLGGGSGTYQVISGWTANHAYAANVLLYVSAPLGSVTIPSGFKAQAFLNSGSGTSGGSEPVWPLNGGGTVNDNGITWTNVQWDLITGQAIIDASCFGSQPYSPGNLWKPYIGEPTKGEFLTPITKSYTLGARDSMERLILADATSGAITITVPDNAAVNPWPNPFTVVKIDSTANAVTVSNTNFGFLNPVTNAVATTDTLTQQNEIKTYVYANWISGAQQLWSILSSNNADQRLASLALGGGTKTATDPGSGVVTLNTMSGKVTSRSLTTAAGSDYILEIDNTNISGADQVFASVQLGTSTNGEPAITSVQVGTNFVLITVRNIDPTNAFNGTIKISFMVLKN